MSVHGATVITPSRWSDASLDPTVATSPQDPTDGLATASLQMIVDAVAILTGARLATIASVRNGTTLEVLVTAAGELRSGALGAPRTSTSWTELESAEGWGHRWFVAGGRPGGRLVAPLTGDHGELVGYLWVDTPTAGRPPDATGVPILELYVEQAGRALALAGQRRTLSEKVRLVEAAREVVRRASRELEIDALMGQICPPVVEAFQAVGMWLHAFDHDGESRSTLFDATDQLGKLAPELTSLARRIAEDAWRGQRVGIVSTSRLRGGLVSPSEVDALRDFLAQIQVGSLLFIPMGVGVECTGSLILARALADSLWSEGEIEVALNLGHDLGQAVLTARAFERERELVQRLQALDAHKAGLIATMSHELKSPLAAIMANAELLDDVCEDDVDARAGLDAITRGTQRLVRVVDDLLVMATVSDPEAPPPDSMVDLGALVQEAADLKRAEALGCGVTIRVELPDGIVSVPGDLVALDLLVVNLVSNAVKYTTGGGTVTVTLTRAGDRAVLTCTDEGIGISEADQARIFEEFFRSGDRAARARTGTGLGLSIVDRIVRRHHGTIEVTSALGHGSSFRVELPADPDVRAIA